VLRTSRAGGPLGRCLPRAHAGGHRGGGSRRRGC